MSLVEASFKVKHECPYRTLSEQHPDITIREWFMTDHQILEVAVPGSPTEAVREAIDDLGTRLYETEDERTYYAAVRSSLCSRDDSLLPWFEEFNCLYTPPTTYREGWEHYTVTAFDDRDVRSLLGELDATRDIEVLSTSAVELRRIPHSLFMTPDVLFGGMTPRQLEALRIALDGGYFDEPRGASIAELATRTTVARSTFEEHLRKAQNRLIANAEQLIRLLTDGDEVHALRHRTAPQLSP